MTPSPKLSDILDKFDALGNKKEAKAAIVAWAKSCVPEPQPDETDYGNDWWNLCRKQTLDNLEKELG